jgi:class 3 adenylate cyclase
LTEPPEPVGGDPATPPSGPGPSDAPATELRTFLIADIRGYTAYTREHGDEAGAALAARFAELVAEVVSARGGFLLELRGDEALVVFVSARNALRAALELQGRFAQEGLPRGVGIGLDAGEAIPVGDGYRGTALNLAARLCAKAGPGETLASEAVIHLAAKMEGIAYVDVRDLRLKGYADRIRVLGVVPSDKTKGHRVATSPRFGGLQWNRTVVAAGAAGLILVVGAAALASRWLAGDPSQGPSASTAAEPLAGVDLPALAFYDADTGQLEAATHLAAPRNIAFFVDGSFWILGENPAALNRISATSHTVEQTINIPVNEPSGFNIDDDYFWVTDLGRPHVVRIDLHTGVHDDFYFGQGAHDNAYTVDVAVGAGSVWLSRPDVPEIVRLNRKTGKVQARLDVPAWGLSFGAGGLWWWREGQMSLIDPDTNESAFDEPMQLSSESWLGNIHFGGGAAWTASADTGQVWRVDSSGRQRTYALQPGVTEMAATKRTMWVTNEETGRLNGIDLTTGEQNRFIDTGHGILAVAASEEELMIAVSPTFDDAVAGLSGAVLKVGVANVPWWEPSPDPPVNGSWQLAQTLYVTCANLVNYPDEAGADGLRLAPEVALAMPQISADGLTYAFTIRPGFAFSPPNNDPLTAETFRYTIQRALDPAFDDGTPGPETFGDILGAEEYRAGDAKEVAGLTAAGDRLTITLRAPAPDFLDRLASGAACPVPIGTPALHSGINPVPPVAGAGPYYLAQITPKRFVVLEKNPNYHGSRPQPFDAIAIRMKAASATAISMVDNHKIDAAMLEGGDPLTGAASALAAEWGPESSHAADGQQRWFGAARSGVEYLALNPAGPAFRDLDVRRAVSLAIDRARLAAVWGDAPATSLLGPGVRGNAGPDVAVSPPDLEAARALMNGRSVHITMLGFPSEWGCGPCNELERELRRQLKAIGMTVTIRRATDYAADAFQPNNDVDLVALFTDGGNPEPVGLLGGLREDAWLGRAVIRDLERLDGLSGDTRIDRAAGFADQVVRRQALVIPYARQMYPFYVADRIGCGFVQPAIGAVDLLSLCIR